MTRVVLLRGANLNEYEMQTYAYLADRFDMRAVAARRTAHATSRIQLPIDRVWCSTDFTGLLPGRAADALELVAVQGLGIKQRVFGLARHVRDADIVHTADPTYTYSVQAARLKRRFGFKLAVTQWENIPFAHEWTRRHRRHKETVIAAADAFVAVSERAKLALELEGAPPERIHIIPPGIDVDRFQPPDHRPESDRVRVAYVGRLNRLKGVEFLLAGFARAVAAGSTGSPAANARLALAGAGRQRRRLERLAHRLGIAERVTWLGAVPYDELPRLYAATDIFVLPSLPFMWWQEQLGMVLLEAMASGCAVVAAQSGSIPEVVGDAGVLCQPGDVLSLSQVLGELFHDPERRRELGALARGRALERFDARRNADRIGALYQGL